MSIILRLVTLFMGFMGILISYIFLVGDSTRVRDFGQLFFAAIAVFIIWLAVLSFMFAAYYERTEKQIKSEK